MPTSPARALRFLHACHAADGAERVVSDLLAEPRFPVHTVTGDDAWLAGVLDRAPLVDDEAVDTTLKLAATYLRERTLVVGFLPIVGRRDGRSWCAPLLLGPARIDLEDVPGGRRAHLVIDPAAIELHLGALAELSGRPVTEVFQAVGDLPSPPLSRADVVLLLRDLVPWLPGVDLAPTRAWPTLVGTSAVAQARATRGLRCLPAMLATLVRTGARAEGVLYELEAMAETPISPVVAALLGAGDAPARLAGTTGPVPWVPSGTQLDALDAARSAPLTTVIGPPGTGKSTTLAAMALATTTGGGSVVVATRTSAALDAVQARLDDLLGAPCPTLRHGGGRPRALLDQLDTFLGGDLPFPACADDHEAAARAALETARRRLSDAARALRDAARHEHALQATPGWLGRSWTGWRLARLGDAWDLAARYQEALHAHVLAARRFARVHLREGMRRARERRGKDLRALLAALRARASARRIGRLEGRDLEGLLRDLPPWLVEIPSVHRALPLVPGVVDLAIVDEATHVDPASALPIVHRARRTVVSGDPRQLRHVSFLARAREEAAAAACGLDADARARLAYRDRSLLDLALGVGSGATVTLHEHFRSRPALIAFSNRTFYGGRLAVMTARPGDVDPAILVHQVAGQRGPDGVNAAEADALVAHLVARCAAGDTATFGVVSPFRDQVEGLRARIASALSTEDMARHDLRIDTPHGFQGLERDIVWLSFAADATSPAATWRYLDRPDVFNVAVTRARDLQHVFVSVPARALPPASLVRRYLEAAAPRPAPPAPRTSDPALQVLADALEADGWTCTPEFEVGAVPVDLVAVRDGHIVAIDLVGQPGPHGTALAPHRLATLHRAGLPVVPIPWSRLQADPDACVAALRRAVGVAPEGG